MNKFAKELVETIAALYSGDAMKGDPTEIKITGHVVWLAQQAKKEWAGDAGESTENEFSNRLTDCRSRLLDADALLNYLRKPENLNHMLESDSPEVTLAAMIERTFNLVSDACGETEILCRARDPELAAEANDSLKVTGSTPAVEGVEALDTIDMIHEHTRSMLLMMLVYLEQAREGGTGLNELVLENYVGQMIDNMDRAVEASCALSI